MTKEILLIKPCPFCRTTPKDFWPYYHPRCPYPDPWYLECPNEKCDVNPSTPVYGTKEDVLQDWNSGLSFLQYALERIDEMQNIWTNEDKNKVIKQALDSVKGRGW